MVSDRRRSSPQRGGGPGPMRNTRSSGGGRMVPYQPKRIKGAPNKRCYVNNLPYDLKWQSFKDHMKEAGNVTFVELFEDGAGKSMGCGLVEYSSPEEAKKAVESLNDSKINGREIKVKPDEVRFYPKVPDPNCGPGPMMPPPDMQQLSNVVFVSNLAYEITPKFLRDTFKSAGDILKVNLERDRDNKSKGFGTVVFANPDMALRSIDMFNGRSIKGRKMSVRLDRLTSVNVPPPHMGPMGPGPMGPGPMGPGPMGPGPMGPGPMGPGPMGHGPMGPGPGPMGPGPIPMGPGPMDHGHMGPSPMDYPPPMSHGPSHQASQPLGTPQPQTQSQLLQSIGLAAISSMLQGGSSSVLSGLMAADPRGGGSSSALENLLGRDTLEGLLKTQNVGSSSSTVPAAAAAGYSVPYQQEQRSDYRDYSSSRDRESGRDAGDRRHSPDRYKYRETASKSAQIFVRNIPFTLGNQQLRDFFRHAGHILDCNVMLDKEGRSRGCGTVRFESSADCDRAINMFHRAYLQGREIEVRIDN